MEPSRAPYDDEGREVRTGHWETDDDGGFIVDAESQIAIEHRGTLRPA